MCFNGVPIGCFIEEGFFRLSGLPNPILGLDWFVGDLFNEAS